MRTVFTTGGANPFPRAPAKHLIEVRQEDTKRGLFTVIYGLQVTPGLTYTQACTEIGACVLHSACCEGLATNEGV